MNAPGLTRRGLLTGLPLSLLAGQTSAQPSTAARAAAKGIILGAAVEPSYLEDPRYARLIADTCSAITAENALKWNAVAPRRGEMSFVQAERLATFARARKLRLYGHCLVWHEALPDWLGTGMRADQIEGVLHDHIQSEVGHFKGTIDAWDVVNEAIERNDRRSDGLRDSLWLRGLGPRYLDLAFQFAHRADPQAILVLSDYGLEYDDETWMVEKRGTMLKCLEGLVTRGVPIGALGIQAHLIGNRRPAYDRGLRHFLSEVSKLGLQIFITELDVDDHQVSGSLAARDAIVASHYKAFLDCVLDETAVKRVTTWGLSDRYSSKRDMMPRLDGQGVRPLPFDAEMEIKPAGVALLKALAAAPNR